MIFLVAIVSLAAVAVLWAWSYSQHRRPDPAAWTNWPGVTSFLMLLMTFLGPLGVGLLIATVVSPGAALLGFGVIEAAISAAAILAALVCWPRLMRPVRGIPLSGQVIPFPKVSPANLGIEKQAA